MIENSYAYECAIQNLYHNAHIRDIIECMKHLFVFFLCILLTPPTLLLAHTSDERYVDGYVVDLSTAPIAPWVGEKMGMSFVFLDPLTFRATTTVTSATMVIDATFRANRKPQEVIYTSPELLVKDSGIITSYTFEEEGTYDIHLTFTDSSGNIHTAGYRKQVRNETTQPSPGIGPMLFFATITLIAILSFTAGRLWKKM